MEATSKDLFICFIITELIFNWYIFFFFFCSDWGYKFTVSAAVISDVPKAIRPPFTDLAILRLAKSMAVDSAAKIVVKDSIAAPIVIQKSIAMDMDSSDQTIVGSPTVQAGTLGLLRGAFLKTALPFLLQNVVTHTIMTGAFDSKSFEMNKDIDLAATPKSSNSYVSRILQTLSGCNSYYDFLPVSNSSKDGSGVSNFDGLIFESSAFELNDLFFSDCWVA